MRLLLGPGKTDEIPTKAHVSDGTSVSLTQTLGRPKRLCKAGVTDSVCVSDSS